MKINFRGLIVVLAISSPCFASALDLIVSVSYVAVQFEPGYCSGHSPAGYEMNQGVNSYERQVQRVLEPATEDDVAAWVKKSR